MPITRLTRRLLRRLVPLFIAGVLLQGCASAIVNINPEDLATLKSAPAIYVVRYVSVPLDLMTPKSVVGGGLLASMTRSSELPSGAELQRAFKLPSASEELTNQFVQKLKTEGRMTNLRVEPAPLPLPWVEDVSKYRNKYMGGLVLEITAGAAAGYQPMRWQTYNFNTYGKVRLIRAADGKVLWLNTCNDGAQTLDVSEFEANGGARLKQLIRESTDRCSRILADKLLGKAS